MKEIISKIGYIFILLIFFQITAKSPVSADWWTRPSAIPTQPSYDRNLEPTNVVHPSFAPTSGPNQPATAPTSPPTGGTPGESGGGSSSGGSSSDPCAAGQSYVGPYCGWSPDVNNSGGGGGTSFPRIGGGPQVLGLSNTSGSDVFLSDIMILAGVLCLLLYAKSKLMTSSKQV